jgi:hypothetical protein
VWRSIKGSVEVDRFGVLVAALGADLPGSQSKDQSILFLSYEKEEFKFREKAD